jgi:AraC-like DNA-binding protein
MHLTGIIRRSRESICLNKQFRNMEKSESLNEFYQKKFNWMPESIRNEIGHFNIFDLKPFLKDKPSQIPYKRRDFYKIMFVEGQSHVHYADKSLKIQKQALSFGNPFIPYKWEHLNLISDGIYCIFNQSFFHDFSQFSKYEVFQPQGTHVFELTDQQAETIKNIFQKMQDELVSEYRYKYDVIRTLVFDMVHFAMKMQPTSTLEKNQINASQRISSLFLELLERQFPIDETHPKMSLRTASEFADQLNVHVNHLNRAIKITTQKTTSQFIAERILQEAKIMLRHSNWNVGEIAYSLGFNELTHFNNFFKKHVNLSPLKFRNHQEQ